MTDEKSNVVDMNEWLVKHGKPPKSVTAKIYGSQTKDIAGAVAMLFTELIKERVAQIDKNKLHSPDEKERLTHLLGNTLLLKTMVNLIVNDIQGDPVAEEIVQALRQEFGIEDFLKRVTIVDGDKKTIIKFNEDDVDE